MKETLGSNIKKLRKNKEMTLKALSRETQFSISFLSQLERGKSSATLESLKKISLALGVNPGYFFNDTESGKLQVRHDSLEKEHKEKHQIYYKSLSNSVDHPVFSPHLVVLNPGQNKGNLIKHPGQEFLYVLTGQLTVQIEHEIHTLNPSDSIMFDSGKEHYWYNYTDEDVTFLYVNYDDIAKI